MSKKKTLYRTLLILGLGLLVLSLVSTALLGDHLPNTAGGAMIGVSSGLAAMGLANLLMLRQAERDPRLAKQAEIAEKDERNTAIRRRAKAVSGEALDGAGGGVAVHRPGGAAVGDPCGGGGVCGQVPSGVVPHGPLPGADVSHRRRRNRPRWVWQARNKWKTQPGRTATASASWS